MVKKWSQFNEAYNSYYYTQVLRNVLRVNFKNLDLENTYLSTLRNDSRIAALFVKNSEQKLYNFYCELWSKIPTSINSNRYIIIPRINELGFEYKLPYNTMLKDITDKNLLQFIEDNYTEIFDTDTCYELMNQMFMTNINSHIAERSIVRFLESKGYDMTRVPTLSEDVSGIDIWLNKNIPIQVKSGDIVEEGNDIIVTGTLDLYKISNIRYMFINSNHIYSFKPNTFKAIKEGHKWRIQTNSTYTKLDWQTTFLEFNRNDNALTDAALIIHNF